MAVRHGYGKIAGADALVFAYDTGDTRNSYRGEPTENLVDNANFNNGTTNWNENQNVTLSIETINGTRFLKISSNQTNSTPGLKSANIPVTGNTTYTLTIRAYKNDSRTALMYATGNGTGGADIVWSNSALNGPNPITTELTTISRTFTTPSDMTYIQIGFLWSAPLTTSEVYVEYAQLEQKSHATQFVNGTRSATQGLLDLTGNNTIDLSNTGFDSNAQPVFDGTNDRMDVGTGILSGTGDFTVEAVVQSDYQEVNGTIFANYPSGNFQTFFSGRYIGLFLANNSAYLGSSPFTTVLPEFTTDPIHFLALREGTETRVYLNGVLKKTGSSSSTIGSTSATFRVGANTSGTEDFLGSIFVVKAYNRALTAAEVKNNYRHYKTRFGI